MWKAIVFVLKTSSIPQDSPMHTDKTQMTKVKHVHDTRNLTSLLILEEIT